MRWPAQSFVTIPYKRIYLFVPPRGSVCNLAVRLDPPISGTWSGYQSRNPCASEEPQKTPWQAPFKTWGDLSIPSIQRELALHGEINYNPLPKICSILPERLAVPEIPPQVNMARATLSATPGPEGQGRHPGCFLEGVG